MVRSLLKFAVAPTASGALAVAWSDKGVVRSWMHAGSLPRARDSVLRAYPDALEMTPPPPIAMAVREARGLLSGVALDLAEAELDMTGVPDFDRRVYEIARTIRPGSTMTYGAIAAALGEEPMRARDVGVALARNRFAPFVPCHRVVAAGGKLGGYSAPGGVETKRRLLELEGVQFAAAVPNQPGLFDGV